MTFRAPAKISNRQTFLNFVYDLRNRNVNGQLEDNLDVRSRGRWFKLHWRHCVVSLSITLHSTKETS